LFRQSSTVVSTLSDNNDEDFSTHSTVDQNWGWLFTTCVEFTLD
jgi:hypothetical protein